MAEERKLNKSGNRRGMGKSAEGLRRASLARSKSESKERGFKGGSKSGIVRKEAKSLREAINTLMSMQVVPSIEATVTGLSPELKDFKINYQTALGARLLNQALNGDLKAAELLTKLSGDIIEKHELTGANGAPLLEKKLTEKEADDIVKRLEEKFGTDK